VSGRLLRRDRKEARRELAVWSGHNQHTSRVLREILYASLPRPADSLTPIRRVPLLSFVPGSYTPHMGLLSSIALAVTFTRRRPWRVHRRFGVGCIAGHALHGFSPGSRGPRAANPFVRTFTLALLPHPLVIQAHSSHPGRRTLIAFLRPRTRTTTTPASAVSRSHSSPSSTSSPATCRSARSSTTARRRRSTFRVYRVRRRGE
jgi:hypothetical protein